MVSYEVLIMQNKKQLMNFMGKWKGRLSFASSWVSLVGLPFLFVGEIQRQLSKVKIDIPFSVLLAISLILLFLFAYVIDRYKLIEAEVNYGTEQSAIFRGMKNEGSYIRKSKYR